MSSSSLTVAPSYRALLEVPSLWRVLLGMSIARVAGAMVSVAMVLFTLTEYHSPALAGLVTFVSIMPGLLLSPIAGALLDRHGRSRLVIVDYVVAAASMWLIGGLAIAGVLSPALLVLIAAISSLTGPLSTTGLRSLLPLIVPPPLWERANAVDSNGYVMASLLGPPIAGALVGIFGGPTALIAIGGVFGVAAIVLIRIPDPATDTVSTGSLLVDAWQGLVYTVRHATLRALALSISTGNVAGGIAQIVIPILVLVQLGLGPAVVGLVWAATGLAGMAAAFLFGRVDTRGREKRLMFVPQLGMAAATLLLIPVATRQAIDPALGLALIAVSLGLIGFLNGPLDVSLFTVRQRRTDPAWTGRAFAVSMSLNYVGMPIGSAVGGALVVWSVVAAILLAVAANAVAAVLTWRLLPD
ncbi:MAG: MFS transporter [Chloroflexota bacterium]|jgi:MFS family permease